MERNLAECGPELQHRKLTVQEFVEMVNMLQKKPEALQKADVNCPAHKYMSLELLKFSLKEDSYSRQEKEFARCLYKHDWGLLGTLVASDMQRLQQLPDTKAYVAKNYRPTLSTS